jgi:ATP-binding cassette, subfamily B, multidrug efflux pump
MLRPAVVIEFICTENIMHSYYLIKPYFLQRRFLVVAGIIALMAVDTLQLLIPLVVKRAVDDLTALAIDTHQLAVYAGHILAIAVGMAVLRYFWRRFLIGTSRVVEEGLRNDLFAHIQTLSAPYFDRSRTGDLMAHAVNDINNIRMAVGMGMVALTDAVFLGTAAICFMAYINLELTLFALIPMPVIVWFTKVFGRKMHRRYGMVQQTFSELTETVRESYAGNRIIKAFNREETQIRGVDAVSRDYIRENLKLVRITGTFFPLMLLFTNVSVAIVVWMGGRQTILGDITPGDFVAFISYLNMLAWPMMALGWVTNLIQRGAASLDRLDAIFMTSPDIVDDPGSTADVELRGRIEFENVSCVYGAESPAVLSDITIMVSEGDVLGIVGPQGGGKSTLLYLIPRLYDVTGGRILIDGTDIKNILLARLRNRIGVVPQEPFLFSGTIRDNITLGRDISPETLMRTAEDAALQDTITAFPEGYDTAAGEKGVVLSGGQKQRIVLARALLMDVPILLLDDPVGQVDTRTAEKIIATIYARKGRQTILVASHRMAAVRFADRIITIEDGRITESGTHDQLLASGGYYARTWHMQQLTDTSSDGPVQKDNGP